jgi:hypothetical protein
MAVNLSFIGGAGWQFLDNNGNPLSGGKIYTYAAGTTTPLVTYTSRTGLIANSNPIILDSAGRTPEQIWSTEGLLYKYVVADSNDNVIRTWDNIGGSVVASDLAQDLANTTNNAKGDALIGFKQSNASGFLTNAVARTVNDKLQERVSVLDFGADSTGILDSTNAFNSALATGKRVFVPKGTYLVADIQLPSNAYIEGEERANVLLVVNTNNSGAFTFAECQSTVVENLSIRAGGSVTGARGFKQTDRSQYMAYCKFYNIDTWSDLQISYEIWPIFHTWEKCRDGFNGTAPGGQTHQGINAVPTAYGQLAQCNINQILRCQFFRSTNSDGALKIHYGIDWKIVETDFENNTAPAATFVGVYNVAIDGCWFELNSATFVIGIDVSPSPNPQGTRPVEITNCHVFFGDDSTVQYFILVGNASRYAIRNTTFARIVNPTVLSNFNPTIAFEGVETLSDSTGGAFLAGFRSTKSNAILENSVISSPSMQNINVLPIGPSGLGATNLSSNYNGAIDPNPTDVASGLGLPTDAIQYTLGTDNQWIWYSFNPKMIEFLEEKTITVVINGYGVDALLGDNVAAQIWNNVTPGANNASAASTNPINPANFNLQTSYVTYKITAGSTELHVGWRNGGNNSNKLMVIETMAVYLGEYTPILGNIR